MQYRLESYRLNESYNKQVKPVQTLVTSVIILMQGLLM